MRCLLSVWLLLSLSFASTFAHGARDKYSIFGEGGWADGDRRRGDMTFYCSYNQAWLDTKTWNDPHNTQEGKFFVDLNLGRNRIEMFEWIASPNYFGEGGIVYSPYVVSGENDSLAQIGEYSYEIGSSKSFGGDGMDDIYLFSFIFDDRKGREISILLVTGVDDKELWHMQGDIIYDGDEDSDFNVGWWWTKIFSGN